MDSASRGHAVSTTSWISITESEETVSRRACAKTSITDDTFGGNRPAIVAGESGTRNAIPAGPTWTSASSRARARSRSAGCRAAHADSAVSATARAIPPVARQADSVIRLPDRRVQVACRTCASSGNRPARSLTVDAS